MSSISKRQLGDVLKILVFVGTGEKQIDFISHTSSVVWEQCPRRSPVEKFNVISHSSLALSLLLTSADGYASAKSMVQIPAAGINIVHLSVSSS